MKIEVHDTAFMIAHYRAQHESLSKDPYAKLWLKNDISSWTDGFTQHVSEHDEILHCMRNRYLHDELQKLVEKEPDTLFINLGAGFSMYPYVLPDTVTTLEVELPEIHLYKSAAIQKFISEEKIPQRNVVSIAENITNVQRHSHIIDLAEKHKRRQTIILIEGVFFFLDASEIETVLSLCTKLQGSGDVLFCVSFDESAASTEVFGRLKTYFADVLDSHSSPFTTVPHSYFKLVKGYALKAISSSLDLGKKLGTFPKQLDEKTVLNEYFYTLTRK